MSEVQEVENAELEKTNEEFSAEEVEKETADSTEEEKEEVKEEAEEKEETEEFKCGEMALEIETLKAENMELKATNETYMCELEDLRKFQATKLNEEKLLKIEEVFSQVSELLPKEVISEYRGRIAEVEFSEVNSFCNEIKSRVVDFVDLKTSKPENRYQIITPREEPKKKRFW